MCILQFENEFNNEIEQIKQQHDAYIEHLTQTKENMISQYKYLYNIYKPNEQKKFNKINFNYNNKQYKNQYANTTRDNVFNETNKIARTQIFSTTTNITLLNKYKKDNLKYSFIRWLTLMYNLIHSNILLSKVNIPIEVLYPLYHIINSKNSIINGSHACVQLGYYCSMNCIILEPCICDIQISRTGVMRLHKRTKILLENKKIIEIESYRLRGVYNIYERQERKEKVAIRILRPIILRFLNHVRWNPDSRLIKHSKFIENNEKRLRLL